MAKKWTLQSAPGIMISLFIGLTILGALAGALWSGILTQFTTIGDLGNFTFSSLVGGSSTSLTVILLSVALVTGILAVLGYNISSSSR